jgi:cysteine dioxygenase
MIRTINVHPLKSRVGDFIADLKSVEQGPITTGQVLNLLSQSRLTYEAIAPYVFWSREKYTRNLIYRDDFFEVIALCWLPGQKTPIHSHDGQLGWVTVVQGELVCSEYKFVRPRPIGDPAERKKCAPSGQPVEVEAVNSTMCQADGSVAVVDRRRTTHQIENLEKSVCGSVSLHVYSRPIDACVLFDDSSRCCARQRLQYYSVNGVMLTNPPQEISNAA